jgi:hypothetical protein
MVVRKSIVCACCALLLFFNNAYAYLDPGTGSYIFQLAIAAFVGTLFAVKLFWHKINTCLKNLFSRAKKKERIEG